MRTWLEDGLERYRSHYNANDVSSVLDPVVLSDPISSNSSRRRTILPVITPSPEPDPPNNQPNFNYDSLTVHPAPVPKPATPDPAPPSPVPPNLIPSPPRPSSPPPMQVGRDYTPMQKQSILFTLARFRRNLDRLGLDRHIRYTDLAPTQSTNKREASVLTAQLLGMGFPCIALASHTVLFAQTKFNIFFLLKLAEMEKMKYLTLVENPALGPSDDSTSCAHMDIVLSDDFDFTVPEPIFC